MLSNVEQITDQAIVKNFNKFVQRFDVFAAVILRIKTKAGKMIPFQFNRMQRVLWSLYQEDTKAGRPIRWYIIKARQLGSTTWCLCLLYWLSVLRENQMSLILNYDDKSAQNLGNKVQELWLNSRPVLRPNQRRMNREEIHFANPIKDVPEKGIGLNSWIINQTIDAGELARSFTYNNVVMSEYCFYEQNIKGKELDDQLVALENTIPEEVGTVIIKESSPFGDGKAKEDWEASDHYRKIFISWVAEDKYRLDTTERLELSDVEDSQYGNEIEERNAILEQLRFWYPEHREDLGWLEYESNCRLAWRRYYIDNKLRRNKDKFIQEYPTTVGHAFAGKSKSIFGGFRLAEMESYIRSNNLNKCMKYRYQHDDEEKNPSKKFYQSPYGHLHIYEHPQEGATYVIGGDGAQGVQGGDESTLFVLKLPGFEEVALFSDIITPERFAGVANYLGLLYNKALLGLEINDKGGFAANERLVVDYRYPNTYYTLGSSNSSRTIRYGYWNNDVSRSIGVNDFMTLIAEDAITIRSQKVLDQMKTFIQNPKTGKCEAAAGKHDDCVISPMIAIQLAKVAKTIQPPSEVNRVRKFSRIWWEQQEKGKSNRMRMAR